MTTRKRILPSLDDAGKMVYELTLNEQEKTVMDYNWGNFNKEVKRHYVKLALEIWRAVDKCV